MSGLTRLPWEVANEVTNGSRKGIKNDEGCINVFSYGLGKAFFQKKTVKVGIVPTRGGRGGLKNSSSNLKPAN